MSITTYKTKKDLISWQEITPTAIWLLVEDDPIKSRVIAPIGKKKSWILLKQALVKAIESQVDGIVTHINIGGDDGYGHFQVVCKLMERQSGLKEAMWLTLRIAVKY